MSDEFAGLNVTVLLFAAHREALGRGTLSVEMPEGSTVNDLYLKLQEREPALGQLHASTTFAVNREVVPSSTRLHSNDEVAFLQPVSGGDHD